MHALQLSVGIQGSGAAANTEVMVTVRIGLANTL